MIDVEEAWDSFIKSQVKKASVDEKLDIIASQMNELQTDISRLAENIPDMQGDAAAMEAANAMAEPEMGGAMEGGIEELLAGGEEAPMPGGEGEPAPEDMEDAANMEEGAPLPEAGPGEADVPVAPMPAPAPEAPMPSEPTGDFIPEGFFADDVDAEGGMGVGGEDMVSKLKDLILNETDPKKIAALSEILSMAADSQGPMPAESMDIAPAPEDMFSAEEVMAEEPVEPIGKSESFEKADDLSQDMAAAQENAETDVELDDGPSEEANSSESFAESASMDEGAPVNKSKMLATRIADAIADIIAEFLGEAPEESAPESAPMEEDDGTVEVVIEEVMDEEDTPEEDAPKEDEISEETDHFEEAEDDETPSCMKKSFQDIMAEKMGNMHGIDGARSILHDNYLEETPIRKHIATLSEFKSIQRSERPDVHTTTNGEITRPDANSIHKSKSGPVSFQELLSATDRHELMEREWEEYNIFKSQY